MWFYLCVLNKYNTSLDTEVVLTEEELGQLAKSTSNRVSKSETEKVLAAHKKALRYCSQAVWKSLPLATSAGCFQF